MKIFPYGIRNNKSRWLRVEGGRKVRPCAGARGGVGGGGDGRGRAGGGGRGGGGGGGERSRGGNFKKG